MRHFTHLAELFILISGGLFTTTIAFAIAWMRARERAVRAEAYMDGLRSVSSQQGVSPAIDAIAMEVERIGEGQRFLTKVIAEQRPNAIPQRPIGSITPH
jgi:hypothetical protein